MAGKAYNYPHLYLTCAAKFVKVSTQQTFLVKQIVGLWEIYIGENVLKLATSWQPATTSI